METIHKVKFSFYGFGIEVKCQDIETLQSIRRDYSFFLDDRAPAAVFFEIYNLAPDYSKLPFTKASSYSPDSICYRQKDLSFIDYAGKGLKIVNHRKNTHKIFCPEPHLRHEIVFLSILSLVGGNFDSRNIHRIHGLGFAVNNEALLILLPSGGGKTTLFLNIIQSEFIKLLSEDSPLIEASGKAIPFPIRIGVSHQNKPQNISDKHLHTIERTGAKPKYVIDIDFFKDKLVKNPTPVRHIFCGIRCLGNESYIKPISKYSAFKEVIKNLVVGLGLYQSIDFLVKKGPIDFFKKSAVLFSRLRNALRLISRSKTYSFVIGFDHKKNAETFLKFCRENINKK